MPKNTNGVSSSIVCEPGSVIVGASLRLLALPVQEYIVPRLAHKLLRSHNDIGKEDIKADSIFFAPDKRGNLISVVPPHLHFLLKDIRRPVGLIESMLLLYQSSVSPGTLPVWR